MTNTDFQERRTKMIILEENKEGFDYINYNNNKIKINDIKQEDNTEQDTIEHYFSVCIRKSVEMSREGKLIDTQKLIDTILQEVYC